MWPQMMLMMSSLVSSSLSFETSEVRDAEMTVLLICDDSSATCCPLFVASCLCPIVLDHVFLLLGGFESTASNCATTCPTPSQHLHVRRWQHLLVRWVVRRHLLHCAWKSSEPGVSFCLSSFADLQGSGAWLPPLFRAWTSPTPTWQPPLPLTGSPLSSLLVESSSPKNHCLQPPCMTT